LLFSGNKKKEFGILEHAKLHCFSILFFLRQTLKTFFSQYRLNQLIDHTYIKIVLIPNTIMSEEDDYNPQDDIVIPSSNAAPNSNGKLSRRKRKRQALEASAAVPKEDTSKRQRMSDDEEEDEEIDQEKSAIHKDGDSGGVSLHATQQTEDGPDSQNKKTKRKDIQKSSSSKKEEEGPSINESIAHMDQGLMADYISQRIRKFQKDLSFVELGDQLLPRKFTSLFRTGLNPSHKLVQC